MESINATLVFFLVLLCAIIYILFEGYKELERMEEKMRWLEYKQSAMDMIIRENIINKINEEEK